ncbi:phage portal protein family protein [Capnocytophaga canis]|uniref:phage portal protein family protein n=1 Tax=Capnocytophaga canis TaxID=1848903 RepID=UPI001562355B|nr:DUF935 family protein [Capnocytophaga canis]
MAKVKHDKPIKISQTLVVRPPERSPQDIQKWRSAMLQADRGRLHTLVDLFNDLLIDTVLSGAVEKRIMAITNANLLFSVKNKEIEAMADFIDTPEFEELLREIMLAKFYPKTVLELDFTNGFKAVSIDRRHLNTEQRAIVRSIGDTDGFPYENNDFLIHLGKEGDLGIFLKTAPHAIFKRNGMSDFAQFAELFGIDMLVGYYDPDDENGREEMDRAFLKKGGGGVNMSMSNKSKVETVGNKSSGTVDIHDRFLDKCDEQILIGILGQTMTTKDGASYSQGKVHADVEEDINKADRRYVQRVLNKELLPRLEKRGYPVAGGWFHFAEKGEKLSKKDELEIAKGVNEIVPVDENYFYENFGLPRAKSSPQIAPKEKEQEAEPNGAKENKEQNPSKGKTSPTRKVQAQNLSLWERFVDFFAQAPR